jgi:predicted ArsR family transcriptional regulator
VAFIDRDAAGIGALTDPLRRQLYLFVCAQPHPVSREVAADALGLAPHQAKFHLDRLERDGLLDSTHESAVAADRVRAGPQSCINEPTAR